MDFHVGLLKKDRAILDITIFAAFVHSAYRDRLFSLSLFQCFFSLNEISDLLEVKKCLTVTFELLGI